MAKTVVAFGEVLWDLLPDGPVLGGAPFNFIYRAAGLGYDAVMVSALGMDALGQEAWAAIEALGLRRDYVQRTPEHPTGTVLIELDKHSQPQYEIVRGTAYDHIEFTEHMEALAASADCVCFGTLAQRERQSRQTLAAFLDRAEAAKAPLTFLDINLRKDCYDRSSVERSMDRADVLKLNDDEARAVARLVGLSETRLRDIAERLLWGWGLQHCIVTMGERGALCVSADGASVYDPGYRVRLVDPCGAGDAFSAGFIHQLLSGRTAREGCRLGNVLGAIVATQQGATQPITREQIRQFSACLPERIIDPECESLIIAEEHDPVWMI